MMSEQNEWFRVQFDFSIPGYDVTFEDKNRREILTGLGRAISFLVLGGDVPEVTLNKMKVLVKELAITPIDFLSDDDINYMLESFKKDMGDSE